MPAKMRAENNALKPLEKPDPTEGEIKSNADRIVGLLKDIDIDSVDLQHAAKDIWVKTVVSD
ncbi:MAG TPA: antitoxin family protein [Methanothrix sp.]|nr:antitoxin family protein [Methanothrix sp.]